MIRIMLDNLRLNLTLFLLLVCVSQAQSQEKPEELFQKANRYYDAGNFKSAIRSYHKLLETGIKDATVCYNLGNAYFRDKQLGKAILYYRKAQNLSPRDREIETNLNYSRLFVMDRIKSSTNFSSVFTAEILSRGTVNEFTFWTFLLYLGSVSLGIVAFFKREKIVRRGLLVLTGMFLILLLFTVLKISQESAGDDAVVTVPSVEAFSGPGKDFALQFTSHEGLEVTIEQEKDDWYLISLPNQVKGWLPKAVLEKI